MQTIEVLTAILVGLTGVYAWLTARILRANEAVVSTMQAERRAALRPYVTIGAFTQVGSYQVYLRIENTGKTAARALRLLLDRPFHRFGHVEPESDLQTFAAFSQEIACFPPGARLTFALAMGTQLFGDASAGTIPQQFQIRAQYSWAEGREDESWPVDLRPFKLSTLERDPVVDQLEAIKKELAKKG